VLCLDWDKRSLRLVVARVGGGAMALEDAHSHRLPSSVDVNSPQALGEFIAQTTRRHHWHYSTAIVDVPRDKAVINQLTLAPTPEDELAGAVRFQALKELPFPLDEAVIDYVVLERDERNLVTEVLLAAVRNETLDRIRETCEAAGLKPARIGLRPYANLVAVTHLPHMAERRVLFVEVGPAMTEIDVFRGGTLVFSRAANVNVPLGGAADEDAEVSALAERPDLPAQDEAADAAVRELVLEVVRTMQAYRASEPNAVVDHVVIAGNVGVEAELQRELQRRFDLPTTQFDPSEVLSVETGEAAKLRSFSAALGLAWGLSREGLLALDFLNPKQPVQPGLVWKRRARIAGIAAALVVTLATAAGATWYHGERKKITALQGDIAELTEKIKAERQIANTLAEVTEEWDVEGVWLDHLLRITQCVEQPGEEILVRQMKFDQSSGTIALKLLYSDTEAATRFATRLREVSRDDEPLYRVTQHTSRPLRSAGGGAEGGFNYTVDLTVTVLELEQHRAGADAREKQRRERLKPAKY